MFTKIIVFMILLIVVCFAEDAPQIAPLNPEFIKYMEDHVIGQNLNFDQDYPLGYIPPPVKMNTGIPKDFTPSKSLPDTFDLRIEGKLTSVKSQGGCGSCWAFATMGAIEGRWKFLGLGDYDLSENNLIYGHGFEWEPCDGGNANLSTAYLSRYDGPISEADDPYEASGGDNGSYHSGLTPQAYISDVWFLPKDAAVIKQALMDYGALYTNMRWDANYYNSAYTYYYSGNDNTNHAVLLCGWNDDKVTAGGTGAWIIRNSWDTTFGEEGFFYISYNDTKVNTSVVLFKNRVAHSNSAEVKYYDKLGNVLNYGWPDETDYGLIKFEYSGAKDITKVGTWVNTANSVVSFEIFDDFNGSALTNPLGSVTDQTCNYAGYHTFNLTTPVSVSSNSDIYIKVKYNTPNYNYSIPVESYYSGYADPQIEAGKCWVSSSGTTGSWAALGNDQTGKYDLCIKAYGIDDASLPVELSEFNTKNEKGSVRISWATESELNNLGFNLYRSTFAKRDFKQINREIISGAINSSERHNYSFIDKKVVNGVRYYYQLEDVSLAGVTKKHDIGSIIVNENIQDNVLAMDFVLHPAFPNPFNPETKIKITLVKQSRINLNIFNLKGELVKTLVNSHITPGTHSFTWNATDQTDKQVPSGVYIIQMENKENIRLQKVLLIK